MLLELIFFREEKNIYIYTQIYSQFNVCCFWCFFGVLFVVFYGLTKICVSLDWTWACINGVSWNKVMGKVHSQPVAALGWEWHRLRGGRGELEACWRLSLVWTQPLILSPADGKATTTIMLFCRLLGHRCESPVAAVWLRTKPLRFFCPLGDAFIFSSLTHSYFPVINTAVLRG